MVIAFIYGLAVAGLICFAGELAWRGLPRPVAGLAGVAGAAAIITAVAVAHDLGVHLTGAAIPALILGLIAGGAAADGLAPHHDAVTADAR